MGSNIYTRQGDKGQTSLADGTKVPKDAARVEAYGTIDEANSWVGAARAMAGAAESQLLQRCLGFLQDRLYNCSSNLAMPPGGKYEPPTVTPDDIAWLERGIDRFETATGPLTAFVLPGGAPAAGMLHVARTVCRRAERRLVALHDEGIDPLVLKFVNRASDFLFAAARFANHEAGVEDTSWNREQQPPQL